MKALPHIFIRCPNCVLEFRTAAWRVVPGSEMHCAHCEHRWSLSADVHAGSILTAQQACERFDGRRETLRRPWYSPAPREPLNPQQSASDLRAVLEKMRRFDAADDGAEPLAKAASQQ